MQADPGMPRRFPQTLHLADYTPQQLAVICRKVAKSRFGMSLAPDLEEKLVEEFEGRYFVDIANQNGGLAVNLVENATGRLAERIMEQVRLQVIAVVRFVPSLTSSHFSHPPNSGIRTKRWRNVFTTHQNSAKTKHMTN